MTHARPGQRGRVHPDARRAAGAASLAAGGRAGGPVRDVAAVPGCECGGHALLIGSRAGPPSAFRRQPGQRQDGCPAESCSSSTTPCPWWPEAYSGKQAADPGTGRSTGGTGARTGPTPPARDRGTARRAGHGAARQRNRPRSSPVRPACGVPTPGRRRPHSPVLRLTPPSVGEPPRRWSGRSPPFRATALYHGRSRGWMPPEPGRRRCRRPRRAARRPERSCRRLNMSGKLPI
jgi:hypothetical protein